MSYSVTKNDVSSYDIVEKDTNVTINMKTSEKRARELCRKLNLGGGFNGFTPMFFAEMKGKEIPR